MDGACSKNRRDKKPKREEKRDLLGDLDLNRRVILNRISRK
jgi:hypothetical protein